MQKAKLGGNAAVLKNAVNRGALQAIALTEDRLDLRRDERAQSGVGAMVMGVRPRSARALVSVLTKAFEGAYSLLMELMRKSTSNGAWLFRICRVGLITCG